MQTTITAMGFNALGIPSSLCDRLRESGIVDPTPIQESGIPPVLEGNDLIGIAQTGTGKTLAFLLPMIQLLGRGQQGLILAPTRELAQQISETCETLGMTYALVVGGLSINKQIKDLRRDPKVIVATPGRLLDHMHRQTVRFNRVTMVVLDEADRMFDMGFAPAIRRILEATPASRQTLLFSATLPPEIQALAATYLRKDALKIQVSATGSVPELVRQELAYLGHDEKPGLLAKLLHEEQGLVLIFARTRHGASRIARTIRAQGHRAAELHSDRSQAQRREALQGFKSGGVRILVATDIAARGIDVKEIALVVNYDLPENPEDYVHRIGRTGRAGSEGSAISMALPTESSSVRQIERLLGMQVEISRHSTATPAHAPRAPQNNNRKPGHGGNHKVWTNFKKRSRR